MSNTNSIPFVIKTNGSITLYLKGECMTVALDHPNYNKIVDALKNGEHDKIENLVNVAKAVTSYAKGQVRVDNGQVFYGDFLVSNTLTNRILKMMADGFKVDHMLRFLDNLMANPSARAVAETYTFLENFGLPITDDGCFLAYKAVRSDYTDIHSGKFDNHIGLSPSMPRNQVDDNYGVDCSQGLHVGALDYVVSYGHFTKGEPRSENGNRLLIVKVNQNKVVSVPKFEGHTKMRVCEYTVVSEILDVVKELDKVVYTATATPLAPDQLKEPISVNEPLNEADYLAGFSDGETDREEGEAYGFSRNYSASKSYLKGYNDSYNGRENQFEFADEDPSPEEEDDSGLADSDEYNHGYDLGRDDALGGKTFQASLELDESDMFKNGYSSGYNDNK